MIKVLEVNVDDQNAGGVFSLVKNVIINNKSHIVVDIAAIEPFENIQNIQELNEHGCTVHYVGFTGNKFKKQLEVYKRMKALINKECYDCVHIHSDVAYKLIASGLAAKNTKVKKIIFHSHSSGVDGNNRIMKYVLHCLARRLLSFIPSQFVACSKSAARWMYGEHSNAVIINNGTNLEQFRFDSNARELVRRQLKAEETLLIGHVGRFLYQKNHEYLIEIARELDKREVNYKMLLIGEGERKEEINKLVHRYHLDNKVVFYGLSNNVNELMSAMDIFILPSRFEGLPIVGVEAQASGLPIIFSDKITKEAQLTENVEFLPIGAGDLSKWCDSILDIVEKGDAKRSGSFDIVKSKRFDIKDTVDDFLRLYN